MKNPHKEGKFMKGTCSKCGCKMCVILPKEQRAGGVFLP
jgi:hypothetical protein